MIFKPALAKLIVEGRKTATRRVRNDNPRSPWGPEVFDPPSRGSRRGGGWLWRYPVGSTFAVNPGRGLRRVADCEVIGRRTDQVGRIEAVGALDEGFAGRREFLRVFFEINPGTSPSTVVHVVEFKLVRVEDDAIERLDKLLAGGVVDTL